MPLYPDAETKVKTNLQMIAAGGKAPLVAIGEFTESQFVRLNATRRARGLHEVESREILFIGRHLYISSRTADGYTMDDIWRQIESALSETSEIIDEPKMIAMQNRQARSDRYGNYVSDRAVFGCTQRKPRAELFGIIPKGDRNKPATQKAHPKVSLAGDDPG